MNCKEKNGNIHVCLEILISTRRLVNFYVATHCQLDKTFLNLKRIVCSLISFVVVVVELQPARTKQRLFSFLPHVSLKRKTLLWPFFQFAQKTYCILKILLIEYLKLISNPSFLMFFFMLYLPLMSRIRKTARIR